MTLCEAHPTLVQSSPLSAGRTLVVTVLAPPETIFNTLADIENLPRWASGFCERVFLGRGRWMAFTSLGELFLELEADASAGEIVLHTGWEADRLQALRLRILPCPEGGTWIKFAFLSTGNEEHALLHAALEKELPGVIGFWDAPTLTVAS